MRDGHPIINEEIIYQDKLWTITQMYFVEGNPKLYTELYDGSIRLNVEWSDIRPLFEKRGLGVELGSHTTTDLH